MPTKKASKKLTRSQLKAQEKALEEKRLAALRRKAPRRLFVVLGPHGSAISYEERLGTAKAVREATAYGSIIVGPYELVERRRNG